MYILNLSQKVGDSVEFTVSPQVASLGLLCANSRIQAFNSQVLPIFYTALVKQPSTGNFVAMGIFNREINKIIIPKSPKSYF